MHAHLPSLTLLTAIAAALVASAGLSPNAVAAPVKKVLSACDRTSGCNYTINDKNGDISGCSQQSGTCFYCPNDGKRQCFAVRQLPQRGRHPIPTGKDVTITK